MGCGASKQEPKPYHPEQDIPPEKDESAWSTDEVPDVLIGPPKKQDPLLKTFNEILPEIQAKKESTRKPVDMDDVKLPGTPAEAGERELTPQEKAAVTAAQAVVNEVRRQVNAGREISTDPTISNEKRQIASNATDQLENLIPTILPVTNDAFKDPESQAKLKDLIKQIGDLNKQIESSLKPDNEIFVLPKAKSYENLAGADDDTDTKITTPRTDEKTEFERMKEEALLRYTEIKKDNSSKSSFKSKTALNRTNSKTSFKKSVEEDMGLEEFESATIKTTSPESTNPEEEYDPTSKDKDSFPKVRSNSLLNSGNQTPHTQLVEKTKKFSNGDRYIGQVDGKGIQQGKGRYEFSCGDLYIGEFLDGKFEGKGTFVGADGHSYEGEFKNDLYQGKGIFLDETGDKYEGNFDKGERDGYGVYQYASGDKYEGYFKKGEKHGHGKFTSADGKTIYVGDYIQGKRHGTGQLIQKGNKFTGSFVMGKMHGRGLLEYENGNTFEGEFRENEVNGKGIFVMAKDKTLFEGIVNPDLTFGRGMATYANGDVYIGDFLGRKPHGMGYMLYSSEQSYEGEFAEGKRNGRGTFTKKNGESQTGEFQNGTLVTVESSSSNARWGKADRTKKEEEKKEEGSKASKVEARPFEIRTGW